MTTSGSGEGRIEPAGPAKRVWRPASRRTVGQRLGATVAGLRAEPREPARALTMPVLLIGFVAYGCALLLFPFDARLSTSFVVEAQGWRTVLDYLTDVALLKWYFFPALGIAAMLLLAERRAGDPLDRLAAHLTYLAASLGTATTITHALKWTLGRARPTLLDTEGSLSFALWRVGDAFESFPSGHSTNAGVVSMVLAIWFPRWRWPILVVGLGIAATRVAVEAHFPSDVVAGFATGILTALVIGRFLARRHVLYRVPSGGRDWRGLVPRRCAA